MSWFLTLRRLVHLCAVVVRHGVAHAVSRSRSRSGPARLRRMLEEAGGTYLKFGQILSLQPDMLSPEVCEALFDLLDRVPPFDPSKVDRVFSEEFGRGPGEVFDEFDYRVVASASIGQVHRARLGDRDLAVKIRRPGVERVFEADLRFLRVLARLIRKLGLRRWKWLAEMIDEFDAWTVEELDYRYEARFMATMAHHSVDNPNAAIPGVVSELTTPRILVADFLEGITVLDLIRAAESSNSVEEIALPGYDAEVMASNIVTNFVSDAFHYGLFHADLHPANLLALPGNVVGYVDFGIAGSFSRYSRRNMVGLLLALTRADVSALVNQFLRISTVDSNTDLAAFRRGVRDLVEKWYEPMGRNPVLTTTFTVVMMDMLYLTRRTGVRWSPDVTRYIRSVITADGLVSRIAPGLDVSRLLKETCERFLADEVWRAGVAPEGIADWISLGAQLVDRNVASRPGNTVADGQKTVMSPEAMRVGRAGGRLVLGATAVAGSGLLYLAPRETILGFNLLTAELIVVIVAWSLFVFTIRRRA